MKKERLELPRPEIGKKMTPAQWRAMHLASLDAERQAMERQSLLRYKASYWIHGKAAPL